jgi:anaphase-promoting complex subunit 1
MSLFFCFTGSQKEKYKSPSYQIREGDSVNIDVTSPGATLALGMMYFNTGNRYCLVYVYNVKVHA